MKLSRFLLCAVGLLAGGCSRPAANTQPFPKPTAFFEWCASNNFGVKSDQLALVSQSQRSVSSADVGWRGDPSGQVAFANSAAWKNYQTEEEAKKDLDATAATLRRVAQEKGLTLEGNKDLPGPQGSDFVLKYQSGSIHGILEGNYEPGELKGREKEKPMKGYWIRFKLTETFLQS
jgi:hypothetical protein